MRKPETVGVPAGRNECLFCQYHTSALGCSVASLSAFQVASPSAKLNPSLSSLKTLKIAAVLRGRRLKHTANVTAVTVRAALICGARTSTARHSCVWPLMRHTPISGTVRWEQTKWVSWDQCSAAVFPCGGSSTGGRVETVRGKTEPCTVHAWCSVHVRRACCGELAERQPPRCVRGGHVACPPGAGTEQEGNPVGKFWDGKRSGLGAGLGSVGGVWQRGWWVVSVG